MLFGVAFEGNPTPDGLWEYSLKMRQFTKLSPIQRFEFARIQDGVVDMAGEEWVGRFDLAKNHFVLFKGKTPGGLDQLDAQGLPKDFAATFGSGIYRAGYHWRRYSFDRVMLHNNKDEVLPHPGYGFAQFFHATEAMEPIDADHLLLANDREIYVVRLKQ